MAIYTYTSPFYYDVSGWEPWRWLPTLVEGVQIPYAPIPNAYLPSSSVWLDSETIHCDVIPPWDTFRDPFGEFLKGASTGTLVGTIVGLDLYRSVLEEDYIGNWGLADEYRPPRFSYCVGNLIKEEVIVHILALRPTQFTITIGVNEEVIIRSNFKQIYLHHGEIADFEQIDSGSYLLSTDIAQPKPSSVNVSPSDGKKVKVYKSNGDTVELNILGLDSSWNLIVSVPPEPISEEDNRIFPVAGDFFEIVGEVWVIQDPYLMDGNWYGSEMENIGTTITSGFDLFRTSQNQPFVQGNWTGVYLLRDPRIEDPKSEGEEESETLHSFFVPEETPERNAETDVLTGNIIPFSAGIPIQGGDGQEWMFYPSPNYDESEIYRDSKDRYELTQTVTQNGGVQYNYETMPVATQEQFSYFYDTYIETGKVDFLRLEMSFGAKDVRCNFHHPCLVNQYVIQEGYYHKIIGQANGHTIDVSLKSVDGKHNLNGYMPYQIMNQYAWFMNEYEMGEERKHIFEGIVASISDNSDGTSTIISNISGENSATWADLPPTFYHPAYFDKKSYYERFTKTHIHGTLSLTDVKMYQKSYGWKLNAESNSYVFMDFPQYLSEPTSSGDSYKASFVISSDNSLSVGDTTYVTFDNRPEKIGNFDGILNVTGYQGTSESNYNINDPVPPTISVPYIDAPRICLFGYYLTPQWDIDVPQYTQVGICAGYLFGTVSDNGPLDNSTSGNATIFVTTPQGAVATSAFFDNVRQEYCVVYNDNYTRRLTLRRGTLQFKERPRKIEISIGQPSLSTTLIANSSSTSTTMNLDTNQQRTKLIEFDTEPIDDIEITLTNIGNENNYHGFLVSGEGDFSLRGFVRAGMSATPKTYGYNGLPVSPVYLYKPGKYTNLKRYEMQIGVSTEDSPLVLDDPNISNITIEYVNDNQTIPIQSFFDIHHCSDGELIIFYGSTFESFSLHNENSVNNSLSEFFIPPPSPMDFINNSSNAREWTNTKQGVLAIGSADYGTTWFAPAPLKSRKAGIGKPLLIMGQSEYLCSVYDSNSEDFIIFAKRYATENTAYIASYVVPRWSLMYKTFECTPESYSVSDTRNSPLLFLYRPPALTDEQVEEFFTPSSSIVEDGYTWTKNDSIEDKWAKVIGPENTNSDITVDYQDFGIVSAFLSNTGAVGLLFVDDLGRLRMAYSSGHGLSWSLSNIILAYGVESAVSITQGFCYIKEKKIYCKSLSPFLAASGSSDTQDRFDEAEEFAIGTAIVPPQRLSAYENGAGFVDIFFYDVNGLLSCFRSKYGSYEDWKVAPNF